MEFSKCVQGDLVSPYALADRAIEVCQQHRDIDAPVSGDGDLWILLSEALGSCLQINLFVVIRVGHLSCNLSYPELAEPIIIAQLQKSKYPAQTGTPAAAASPLLPRLVRKTGDFLRINVYVPGLSVIGHRDPCAEGETNERQSECDRGAIGRTDGCD